MDINSLQVILARCVESRQQNERFRSLLPEAVPTSLRVNFARCAIDLALEHHSALIRVVEAGEYGSAGALLRPILEASTIGFWFVYVASCEEIQGLQLDGSDNPIDDVPMLAAIAAQLATTFPLIQGLVDGFKKGGAAKWLHNYAHGGTPQLNRRIGPGWTEGDVMLMLIRADLFSVLAGCLETVLAPNPPLSSYGFARRDQLGGEFHREFGAPEVPQQPPELSVAPLLSTDCEERSSES
ncbi:hypothetical protein [Xanthomonas sp. SI]|uniref:DUF6988 family protein n=1 Tax=Xanthomonas sp. SI TaxID=2724123 RepID=UPI00163A09A1|nr:hypothetical protein [Xanthomonas sp. SI]QNH12679.1 hypothetical protein HEP75_02117 [Xanthomonas sp. SI]